METVKVGLFGHYGTKNLGDEAIIAAAIQNLRQRIPNIELKGFSINPVDTQERHNIDSFPIRYRKGNSESKISNESGSNGEEKAKEQSPKLRHYLKKILHSAIGNSPRITGFLHLAGNLPSEIRFLRESKVHLDEMAALIVCGSGQLVDKGLGPWDYPYTLLKWVLLAKSTGTKIFFVSMGAGPISDSLSYWMLHKALSRADYLSYRDSSSKKLIEDHIPGLKGEIYPDIAHSLRTLPDRGGKIPKNKIVAINPMPVFKNYYVSELQRERFEAYKDSLAKLINHILSKEEFTINLYNNHPSDIPVINEVKERLLKIPGIDLGKVNVIHNETVDNLINTISKAEIIVATRFHSTVFPLRLSIPVLGIYYHPKSLELLEEAGLGDFSVDVKECRSEELCAKFDELSNNSDKIKKELEPHSRRYKELIEEQWDNIANLIIK